MRPRWRTVLATLAISGGLVLFAGVVYVYGGFFDVAASTRHGALTSWLIETARMRSIATHARNIQPPSGLDHPDQVLTGTEHFAAHCAMCHGAPGVPKGDIAQGMYPPPPDLVHAAGRYHDAELFWIIRHGIKMTGMPAWADHSDDEIWTIVAFLKNLGSGMTEQQYVELIRATMTQGSHHHTDAPEGAHHHQ